MHAIKPSSQKTNPTLNMFIPEWTQIPRWKPQGILAKTTNKTGDPKMGIRIFNKKCSARIWYTTPNVQFCLPSPQWYITKHCKAPQLKILLKKSTTKFNHKLHRNILNILQHDHKLWISLHSPRDSIITEPLNLEQNQRLCVHDKQLEFLSITLTQGNWWKWRRESTSWKWGGRGKEKCINHRIILNRAEKTEEREKKL